MTFSETLQAIVNLSDERKIKTAVDAYVTLLPVLKKFDKENDGLVLIFSIFGGAAGADGQLNSAERALIKALLSGVNGADVDDDWVLRMVREYSDSDTYEIVHELNKHLNDDQQAALVALVAAICSIDDRIDSNEVAFIRDLM